MLVVVSAMPSQMVVGVSYHAGDCKCCAFSQMIVVVYYHASGCECCDFSQMIVVVYYHVGECKCCAFITWCWMFSSHGDM